MAARWRWVVGLLAAGALLVGNWWLLIRQTEDAIESPSALTAVFPGDPALPRNQPFPGPDASLPPDAQRAVSVAAELAHAGAETQVAEVKLTAYETVMCGRQSAYDHTPRTVWTVWLRGPFRFIAPALPRGVTPLPEPDSILYILDAETFVSQQSLSPWPLPRTIRGANCPPE